MTHAEFIEITGNLEDFFEKELTTKQEKEWFIALKDISKEDYINAIREAYRSCKFMPKLTEILQLIDTKTNTRDFSKYYANNAWCEGFKE